MRASRFGAAAIVAGTLLAGGLVSGTAQAQSEAPAPSCREQVKAVCGGVERGGGAFHDCLTAHEKDFTVDCQQRIERREARFEAVKTACAGDLKAMCADIVPGHGRELMCLKAHQPQLSAACATALPQPHRFMRGFRACRGDVQSFCADVEPGQGRIAACLQTHAAQLSPECGTFINQAKP